MDSQECVPEPVGVVGRCDSLSCHAHTVWQRQPAGGAEAWAWLGPGVCVLLLSPPTAQCAVGVRAWAQGLLS